MMPLHLKFALLTNIFIGNYVGEFATDVTPQIGQPAIKVAVPWA